MNILGIETSCDDTGVSVVQVHKHNHALQYVIQSNIVVTQNHARTGGIVPEIAARRHASTIIPTIQQALKEAQKTMSDMHVIAVTRGPGLIAPLLVGVETAKTIAVTRNIPLIGVNHMEAHIASTFVEHPNIQFPAIALLVSGGHTMIVYLERFGSYRILGETRDDAVGEAFDKVAKMLGLSYPGGPAIERLATGGNPEAYTFPAPMMYSDDFDFSFSGLKTAVLYTIRDLHTDALTKQQQQDIAASFQKSVIQVLVEKICKAARVYTAQTVILGGGVSANKELQQQLQRSFFTHYPNMNVIIPSSGLFTDNGAMIAVAAAERAMVGNFDSWTNIHVDPRLSL